MNAGLTDDEFEALLEVSRGLKSKRLSPRVLKHAKLFSGLKYVEYNRNGLMVISERGTQTLFMKHCIDGLRKIAKDPVALLDANVRTFLLKKSHISPIEGAVGYVITIKGAESLADIDAQH
ncbi:MAG: hypothetical protein RL571_2447 [Pseudomonadota bacterium]|jgi:hypothetical protein